MNLFNVALLNCACHIDRCLGSLNDAVQKRSERHGSIVSLCRNLCRHHTPHNYCVSSTAETEWSFCRLLTYLTRSYGFADLPPLIQSH